MPQEKTPILTVLGRSLRLRCPLCGEGQLFAGWFKMHPTCSGCGFKYDRSPGYFLGSIYFNYGVTALIIVVLYFAVFITDRIAPDTLPTFLSPGESYFLWILAAISILFPAWFFRYARGLWLGFDTYLDPVESDQLIPRDDEKAE